jgi:mRNA interferase RelE/StbE
MFRVVLSRSARKSLDAIPAAIADRIVQRLRSLELNPRPSDVKKLRGREGWRIRVGDYRVIYSIHDEELLILVVTLGHRREVYR